LCEQGDVETARTVIKRMRRRGVRVTAATYLPLFVALRKARRIPRIDRMEELQDEMEGQGIKPSAEV
jgi:pentatricopeptide repeat protein